MIFLSALILSIAEGFGGRNESENTKIKSNLTRHSDVIENSVHPTVIGGYVADMDEFPFAVRLYILGSSSLVMCTGEIVHPKLVITAAHCVQDGGNIVIVTGNSDQTDYVNGVNTHKYARYKVMNVYIHPDFNRYEYIHDVALLKTGHAMLHPGYAIIDISFEKLTQPASVTIYGWGGTENNPNNHQLFGKHLKAQNCTASHYAATSNSYICLMERGICHGDSGGGLIINGSLYGIASFYEIRRHDKCLAGESYYYTAMSEEESFVKDCLEKNGFHNDRPFRFIFLAVFIVAFLI